MRTSKTHWLLLGGTLGSVVSVLAACSGEGPLATGSSSAAQQASGGTGGVPASRGDDVPAGCVQVEVNQSFDGNVLGEVDIPLRVPDDVEPTQTAFDLYLVKGRFDDCASVGTLPDECASQAVSDGIVQTYKGPRLLVGHVQRENGQSSAVPAKLRNLFPIEHTFQATLQWCVAGSGQNQGGAGGAGGAAPAPCGEIGQACCAGPTPCNAGACTTGTCTLPPPPPPTCTDDKRLSARQQLCDQVNAYLQSRGVNKQIDCAHLDANEAKSGFDLNYDGSYSRQGPNQPNLGWQQDQASKDCYEFVNGGDCHYSLLENVQNVSGNLPNECRPELEDDVLSWGKQATWQVFANACRKKLSCLGHEGGGRDGGGRDGGKGGW